MTAEIAKTEEQIAKDKESVARMAGAKASMEAALRRIEALEARLRSVRIRAEVLGKAFGPDVHLRVYVAVNNGYEVKKASVLFDEIDILIKDVL